MGSASAELCRAGSGRVASSNESGIHSNLTSFTPLSRWDDVTDFPWGEQRYTEFATAIKWGCGRGFSGELGVELSLWVDPPRVKWAQINHKYAASW